MRQKWARDAEEGVRGLAGEKDRHMGQVKSGRDEGLPAEQDAPPKKRMKRLPDEEKEEGEIDSDEVDTSR